MVSRLSKAALLKLLTGRVKEPSSCIVKFYTNSCSYCRNLQPVFDKVANENPDAIFFAFNLADFTSIEDILGINGVPTIALIKTGTSRPKIRIMPDPPKPTEETWYSKEDITKFITKENT